MAIQHSRTITDLEVLNDGNDVVTQVEISFVSYDDSDQEATTIESIHRFKLDSEGAESGSEDFSSFASLTPEIVEGWLGDELPSVESKVREKHISWIDSVLNPPAPSTVNKALPW